MNFEHFMVVESAGAGGSGEVLVVSPVVGVGDSVSDGGDDSVGDGVSDTGVIDTDARTVEGAVEEAGAWLPPDEHDAV
ncbi:hypothetical protein, partial [Mycolicibacterium insubricum]